MPPARSTSCIRTHEPAAIGQEEGGVKYRRDDTAPCGSALLQRHTSDALRSPKKIKGAGAGVGGSGGGGEGGGRERGAKGEGTGGGGSGKKHGESGKKRKAVRK